MEHVACHRQAGRGLRGRPTVLIHRQAGSPSLACKAWATVAVWRLAASKTTSSARAKLQPNHVSLNIATQMCQEALPSAP
jgi:hypothetical protein